MTKPIAEMSRAELEHDLAYEHRLIRVGKRLAVYGLLLVGVGATLDLASDTVGSLTDDPGEAAEIVDGIGLALIAMGASAQLPAAVFYFGSRPRIERLEQQRAAAPEDTSQD